MRETKLVDYIAGLKKKKKPSAAIVEITTRCNLHCQFCYVADNHRKERDMPKARLFRIIDQLAEMGCMHICILGGEPFIRKDFIEIYNYIAKKGIFMEIFTNGTLLREGILRKIKEYPLYCLRISIYGASSKTYKELCGSARAFRQVRQGIKLAKKEGINFYLHTVLNKINQKDLDKIKIIAKKNNVRFRPYTHLLCRSDGDTSPYKLSIVKRPIKLICPGSTYIDNLGRLVSCPVLREPNYNLCYMSFRSAWRNRQRRVLKIKCPMR